MIDETAQRWRDALLESVEPYRGLPILLSGGMDSLTLYAALVELGERPVCVSYRMSRTVSEDVAVVDQVVRDHGSISYVVELPTDRQSIERDVRSVVRFLGTGRKTAVECAVPIVYMARLIRAAGFDSALIGDPGIVEDNRFFTVGVNTDGETEDWHAWRRARMLDRDDQVVNGSRAMVLAAESEGLRLARPFGELPIVEVGLSISVAEINSPRQKGIALRAFPDFYGYPDQIRYWRRNKSLQSASHLRDVYHAAFGVGEKQVAAVYARLLREETSQETLW